MKWKYPSKTQIRILHFQFYLKILLLTLMKSKINMMLVK